MSSTLTRPFLSVIVRAGEAERLDSIGHVLLADSSATAGALSSHRVTLGRSADGAVSHRHDNSSELFYILDGVFDLLVEDDVVTARSGDLLVVPLGMAHAFAARHARSAKAERGHGRPAATAAPPSDRPDRCLRACLRT